jgi:hypothetical protein
VVEAEVNPVAPVRGSTSGRDYSENNGEPLKNDSPLFAAEEVWKSVKVQPEEGFIFESEPVTY